MIKEITIDVTNSCNLRCPHCYKTYNTQVFSIDYVCQIIKEEKPLVVNLFGGEPFLEKNIHLVRKLINYCSENNIRVCGTSNLTFNITPGIKYCLNKLSGLATSFNVRRWATDSLRSLWVDNCKYFINNINKPLWCLLTLDSDLIAQNPKDIYSLISSVGFSQTKFEPYVGSKLRPLNKDVDEWLCKYYDYDKNDFLFKQLLSKRNGITLDDLFNKFCYKNVKVIHTDKTVTCCPLSPINIKDGYKDIEFYSKKKKCCNNCKWYNICQGVCPLLKEDESGCMGYPLLYEKMFGEEL